MSEAAHMMGAAAPAHTITHNGKTYTFVSALSNGALVAFEAKLYDRARTALTDMRNDYPADAYLTRLDELRKRYEDGYYAFTSEPTQKFLQTPKGGIVMLSALCGADEGEVVELLAHRSDELMRIVEDVADATFPDRPKKAPQNPKTTPRLPNRKLRGRG